MDKAIIYAKLILLYLAVSSFVNGAIYRLYGLDWIGITAGLTLSVVFVLFVYFKFAKNILSERHREVNLREWGQRSSRIYILLYLILFLACLYTLFTFRTESSIVSPWEIIPAYFFIFYTFLCLILMLALIKNGRQVFLLLPLHFLLTFSIALIVYKLGYGFDPFIHEAAMRVIAEKGAIFPKTMYYLGLYGLVVPFSKLSGLSLDLLNKLAVPVLAGIFIPLISYNSLSAWFNEKDKTVLTVLLGLIAPFSFFIFTTPQNLSYLFLLLAILIGLKSKNWFDLILIYALALAAFISQPISGIPALLFAFAITYYHADKQRFKKLFYIILFITSASSLPAAFLILERGMGGGSFDFGRLKEIIQFPALSLPGSEHLILNAAYLYIFNLQTFIIILITVGLIIFLKNRRECEVLAVYTLLSGGLFISYLLTRLLSFEYLIVYERLDYSNRILYTAILFLIPLIFLSIHWFVLRLYGQKAMIKYSILFFLPLLLCASLYNSYPRKDKYHNSHGYSVGSEDIMAVNWIEQDRENDYIVLANQQVSAAALREFGFKKYYNDNSIFYYPIPTGGEMYNIFLQMIQIKPEKELILSIMDKAGVDTGYFVVNKYWWASKKIIDEAKLSADSFYEINNGNIVIFKYMKDE